MTCDPTQVFNFLPLPTDIHFGFGVVSTLGDRARVLGGHRVMVVTDPGIRQAGILERIEHGLTTSGLAVAVYDRVTADSGSSLIDEATTLAKAHAADVVVGLGGGSALDTAKAVAAMCTNPGSPLDYVGLHRLVHRPLPMIAVPTTAGTGSEVSLWSVFTDDDRKVKVAIGSALLYPSVAVCDPELTMGLPPALTAATGMDALGHAIECYTNNACQPISGALALQAIGSLGAHLRSAVLNGRQRSARYAVMLASTMAGMAMNPTRLGLAHALAMPLGSGALKIPHGLAVAVTLPRVMAFNTPAAVSRFADVARALGVATEGTSVSDAAAAAAEAVRTLGEDIGIPAGLGELGLAETDIASVVTDAMTSGNVVVNPRFTTAADMEAVLRSAL
jgi:alcohol dehydrogenase class IV